MASLKTRIAGQVRGLLQSLLPGQERVRHEIWWQGGKEAFRHLDDHTLTLNYMGKQVMFFLPDGDIDEIQGTILRSRSFYESTVLNAVRSLVPLRGSHVVDAGANIGIHTMYFAKICNAAAVTAFEPNPYAATILRKNVELNKLTNVTIRSEALSDRPGSVSFAQYYPENIGMTTFAEGGEDNIKAISMDQSGIAAMDFLKIDVEDATIRVLRGARDTIAMHRPAILIELFGDVYDEGSAILGAHGYGKPRRLAGANYLFDRPQGGRFWGSLG